MGLIRRTINRKEQRAASFGSLSAQIPGPTDGWRSMAGPVVNEQTSLGHIDVFKCVSIIADAIAMLPIRSHRNQVYRDSNDILQTTAHKLPSQPKLLTDPMPGDIYSEFSFKHRVITSLLTAGNSYNEIGAVDAQGTPSAIMPIHPSKVRKVDRDDQGVPYYEMHDGGRLRSFRDGGTMVHVPGFVQAGSLQGLSPLQVGMQGIALSMAAEEFGARWFGDGANPSGYLTSDEEWEEADAKKVKKGFMQSFGGLNREPAFLYGGLEWHPITVNPDESQFIETRMFQSGQIAGLYRVPPHLVGDVNKSTSWGTGIEEQGIGFVVFTLGPWLTRLEQALTFLLPRGQFAKTNVGALLRGRQKDQDVSFAVGRQWGWLSVNDIRQIKDLPPIPDGDVYLQPLNMVDADKALEALLKNNNDSDSQGASDDDEEN